MIYITENFCNYIFNKANENAKKYEFFRSWYIGDQNHIKQNCPNNYFWKKSSSSRKIHIPIASELSSYSSDLLFSEPAKFSHIKKSTNNRLQQIISGNELNAKLLHASEISSALGTVYLKVNWNKNIFDMPNIKVVDPSIAVPIFSNDILTSISFISIIDIQNNSYFRVIEKYEYGKISTYLFKGTNNSLGERIPLINHHITSSISDEITFNKNIILATFIPNMLPSRDDFGCPMGRSDYDGVTDLFDALDEAYSSWIRDINLGKARLIVPFEYLGKDTVDALGNNNGSKVFNFDKEDDLYVAMDIDTDSVKNGPTMTQFEIRSEQHKTTCIELLERIVSATGYSPHSFGLVNTGYAESGTALSLRERKTLLTKSKKESYWKNKMEQFMSNVLAIDNEIFGYENDIDLVNMSFSDSIIHNIYETSRTMSSLNNIDAVSQESIIRAINPDWNEQQINQELKKIKKDKGEI